MYTHHIKIFNNNKKKQTNKKTFKNALRSSLTLKLWKLLGLLIEIKYNVFPNKQPVPSRIFVLSQVQVGAHNSQILYTTHPTVSVRSTSTRTAQNQLPTVPLVVEHNLKITPTSSYSLTETPPHRSHPFVAKETISTVYSYRTSEPNPTVRRQQVPTGYTDPFYLYSPFVLCSQTLSHTDRDKSHNSLSLQRWRTITL